MGTTELGPASTEGRHIGRGHAPVRLSRSVLSDEQLARAASQGDRIAFATLYERYRAPLSRYCRSILRHPDDSADAFQNAMTAAFTALEREPPSGPLKPWLYRIAHNESIDLIRRRARASEDLVAEAPEPAASSDSDVGEQLQALLADLRLLPERQRGALLMRELAGLEYDQIGRSFATSTVAARKLVYEARVTLGSMREGRDASCDLISRQISDGDGRTLRNRVVRTHLQSCASCAAFERSLHARREQLALVPALPVAGLGIWLATSIGSGAGATKALAGGGAVAGGAVAGTSAIGAGAGVSAGGMVSSLGGAMAVKCLAVCGALAVAGAGAALATHAPRRASQPAPLTSAAVHRSSAAVAGSAQLRGAARASAAGARRAVTAGANAHPTATGASAGHGAAVSGGQQLRLRQLGGRPAAGHSIGATHGPGASGTAPTSSGASATSPSATATTASAGSTTASATPTTASATSTTVSATTTTASGGASPGASPAGAFGSGSSAASSGASSSRTSATSATTLASAIATLVEGSVASATSTAGSSRSTISSLLGGFLGGNATASSPGGATSTATASTSAGSSTSSNSSPLSGLFGLFSGG